MNPVDNTQLLKARLEVLDSLFDRKTLQVLYRQSDMMIFVLEVLNVAEGVTTLYGELMSEMNVDFYVRFPFEKWLGKIDEWKAELKRPDYLVDADEKITRYRTKRLSAMVYRLCQYNTDNLPSPSADSTTPLDDKLVLAPFLASEKMTNQDVLLQMDSALDTLYDNLVKLQQLPGPCSEEVRHTAVEKYLAEAKSKNRSVENELRAYSLFCESKNNFTIINQLLYLRKRLKANCGDCEIGSLKLTCADSTLLLNSLNAIVFPNELNPTKEQMLGSEDDYASNELLAKLLCFVDLSDTSAFPMLNEKTIFQHLTRCGIHFADGEEQGLRNMFALMVAMQPIFRTLLAARDIKPAVPTANEQERVKGILDRIHNYNALIQPLLAHGKTLADLNEYYDRLLTGVIEDKYAVGRSAFIGKCIEGGSLDKAYVFTLRQLYNLHFFKPLEINVINKKERSMPKALWEKLRDAEENNRISYDSSTTFSRYFAYSKDKLGDDYQSWHLAFDLFDHIAAMYQ